MKIHSAAVDLQTGLNANSLSKSTKEKPVVTNGNSGAGEETSKARSAGTSVSLSLSGLLKSEKADATPAFNSEKVNTVKAAIANGTYVIDHGAIADKLLQNAQEMLTATPKE